MATTNDTNDPAALFRALINNAEAVLIEVRTINTILSSLPSSTQENPDTVRSDIANNK